MTATRAPDLARARQLAAPMPLPPPVTSATLPLRSIVILSSSLLRRQRPAWVERLFDVGVTQAALARPNDIGRDRVGIEQDLDTLLVGRPSCPRRPPPRHRRCRTIPNPLSSPAPRAAFCTAPQFPRPQSLGLRAHLRVSGRGPRPDRTARRCAGCSYARHR